MSTEQEPSPFATFDNMTWPVNGQRIKDIQWRMRYTPDAVTRSDMLFAASVLCAYGELVACSSKKRAAVVRGIKDAKQPVADPITRTKE